jgi:hypothetical protein
MQHQGHSVGEWLQAGGGAGYLETGERGIGGLMDLPARGLAQLSSSSSTSSSSMRPLSRTLRPGLRISKARRSAPVWLETLAFSQRGTRHASPGLTGGVGLARPVARPQQERQAPGHGLIVLPFTSRHAPAAGAPSRTVAGASRPRSAAPRRSAWLAQ